MTAQETEQIKKILALFKNKNGEDINDFKSASMLLRADGDISIQLTIDYTKSRNPEVSNPFIFSYEQKDTAMKVIELLHKHIAEKAGKGKEDIVNDLFDTSNTIEEEQQNKKKPNVGW
jgi:spore coat protein CotF